MPRSIRLFRDAPLHAGATVVATQQQAHYLSRVMRLSDGDAVLLFNGRDGEWRARIHASGARTMTLEVAERTRPQAPEPDLWLLAAPLRRELTELVVQKATELGVARIRLLLTERTNPGRPNLDRLSSIAIEAAEQSERLTVPPIDAPVTLAALLADWPHERRLIAAVERSESPPLVPTPPPAALLVGPEGGIAPAELDVLLRTPFVERASLGARILRAETAAIVGLALMQAPPPPAP